MVVSREVPEEVREEDRRRTEQQERLVASLPEEVRSAYLCLHPLSDAHILSEMDGIDQIKQVGDKSALVLKLAEYSAETNAIGAFCGDLMRFIGSLPFPVLTNGKAEGLIASLQFRMGQFDALEKMALRARQEMGMPPRPNPDPDVNKATGARIAEIAKSATILLSTRP